MARGLLAPGLLGYFLCEQKVPKKSLKSGAKITNIKGRALKVEKSGTVTIGGEISHVTASGSKKVDNWASNQSYYWGVAVYTSTNTSLTFAATAKITDVTFDNGKCQKIFYSQSYKQGAVFVGWEPFTAESGFVISGVDHMPVLAVEDNNSTTRPNKEFGGQITNCRYDGDGALVSMLNTSLTLGSTGSIDHCVCTTVIGVTNPNGGPNGNVTVKGTVSDNDPATRSAFFGVCGSTVTIENGAVITRNGVNSRQGLYPLTTAIVNANTVTMNGGEISNNGGVGVAVKANGFTMKGGKITGNQKCGVYYLPGSSDRYKPIVISGGEISQNQQWDFYMGSGIASDTLNIAQYTNLGNSIKVYFTDSNNPTNPSVAFGTATFESGSISGFGEAGVNDGNNRELKSKILKHTETAYSGVRFKMIGYDALWLKPTGETLRYTLADKNKNVNPSSDLYVAYVPLKSDGQMEEGAELKVVKVENADVVDITLTGLTPGTPYAVTWAQPWDTEGFLSIGNNGELSESLYNNKNGYPLK